MGIVQLPAGRLSGSAERMALSGGLARPTGSRSSLGAVGRRGHARVLRHMRRADRLRGGLARRGGVLQASNARWGVIDLHR